MTDKIYFLSIRDFLEGERKEQYMRQAFCCVDESRRQKAERLKQPAAKAACLGAGLLLQLALREAETQSDNWYTVSQILEKLLPGAPLPVEFTYGTHGKPFLKNYPYYFNLSHSGEYVVCALSEREIGIDIQIHKDDNVMKLAERFFSPKECAALKKYPEEERQKHFFELWTKKEAYGKLTGAGIAEVLETDFEEISGHVSFEVCAQIPGYSIAVCCGIVDTE